MKGKKSSVPLLMGVIVVSKLVGMLRDIVLANYFGTSNISDAYLIAASVPTLIFYFIGHSISTAYIPMYNKVKAEKGEKSAQKYSNNLLNLGLLASTAIVIFLVLVPQVAVKLFATGFNAETAEIASDLIRISSPSIYLMTIVSIYTGFLNANKSFLAPAAVSLPRNLAIVISIVIAASFGTNYLGVGLLVAYIFEFLFLMPFVLRKRYRYSPKISFRDENLKETAYMILPILLGMCVSQINKIIDKSLASTVTEGGISALSYASIINNAVQEVLVTGIITVLFASCAELVAKEKHKEVKAKLATTINVLSFLLLPASVGIILLAEPVVRVILCRGSFDERSIALTSGALCAYTVGLCFLAVRDTLVKVFYAYKDTKTTTITSTLAIVLKIVISFPLAKVWGINGLAIATSISAIFNSIILYILLRKKIGDFGTKRLFSVLIKSIISAGAMAGVILLAKAPLVALAGNGLVSLLLLVGVGAAVYFAVGLVLRSEPIMLFTKPVLSFIKKKAGKCKK